MKKALGLYKEIIYDATHIDLDLLREAVIDKIISDKENVKYKEMPNRWNRLCFYLFGIRPLLLQKQI